MHHDSEELQNRRCKKARDPSQPRNAYQLYSWASRCFQIIAHVPCKNMSAGTLRFRVARAHLDRTNSGWTWWTNDSLTVLDSSRWYRPPTPNRKGEGTGTAVVDYGAKKKKGFAELVTVVKLCGCLSIGFLQILRGFCGLRLWSEFEGWNWPTIRSNPDVRSWRSSNWLSLFTSLSRPRTTWDIFVFHVAKCPWVGWFCPRKHLVYISTLHIASRESSHWREMPQVYLLPRKQKVQQSQ